MNGATGLIDADTYETKPDSNYYLQWHSSQGQLKMLFDRLIKSTRFFRVDFSLKLPEQSYLLHNCVNALFGLAVLLELSYAVEQFSTFDVFLEELYKNGELQDCAADVFNLACKLPFSATRSLAEFLDAIT